MTQIPHIGAHVHYFQGVTPTAAIVTGVRRKFRGEHLIPELREITLVTLTVFDTSTTRAGVEATWGEEFDRIPGSFLDRAFWPVFE